MEPNTRHTVGPEPSEGWWGARVGARFVVIFWRGEGSVDPHAHEEPPRSKQPGWQAPLDIFFVGIADLKRVLPSESPEPYRRIHSQPGYRAILPALDLNRTFWHHWLDFTALLRFPPGFAKPP